MASDAKLYKVKVTGGLLYLVALDFADALRMTRHLVKEDDTNIDAIELIEADAVFISTPYLKCINDKATEQ